MRAWVAVILVAGCGWESTATAPTTSERQPAAPAVARDAGPFLAFPGPDAGEGGGPVCEPFPCDGGCFDFFAGCCVAQCPPERPCADGTCALPVNQ